MEITTDFSTIDITPNDLCVSVGMSGNRWEVVSIEPGQNIPGPDTYPISYTPQPNERRITLRCIKGRDEGKTQTIYEGELIRAIQNSRALYFGVRRRSI